jgi:hypothetical protein
LHGGASGMADDDGVEVTLLGRGADTGGGDGQALADAGERGAMAEQAAQRTAGDAIPSAERLVNLTGQDCAHPGHVVLLAARIPQELAVGLGIQLGQRARSWPGSACPVYFSGGRLFVPDLRLGADSVPAERA